MKTFIGIHCSAITSDDWQRWEKAKAGAMVWSPFSNFWLYGSTADIAAAKKQGVSICIGSDWGPSGSKTVQAELKVAKLAGKKLGLGLTDRELVATVTTNPGDALSRCWNKVVGRLEAGAFGDITVLSATANNIWTHIVESTRPTLGSSSTTGSRATWPKSRRRAEQPAGCEECVEIRVITGSASTYGRRQQ